MTAKSARGFRYALEPVRQQRQWKLDAAQAVLSGLQDQLAGLAAEKAHGQARYEQEAGHASRMWAHSPDPVFQGARLVVLSNLRQQQSELARRIEDLQSEIVQARELCMERQRAAEVLEEHRREALSAHAANESYRESVQADQAWIGREQREE